MMFIVEFHGKLSRLKTRLNLKGNAAKQKLQEQTSPQWLALGERGCKMIEKWRKIKKPAPAIQDQIAEFLYEYSRSTIFQVLLRGNVSLLDSNEVKPLIVDLISMLYPREDYATEIFARIRFIAEKMLAAEKSGVHDHNSPLDTLSVFRRMLGRHLWENDETVRRLKCCRDDYASLVIRKLHEVEYEQSRYDSWEMRYLECERRYHQILNQIGEITRPAGTSISKSCSPWKLRTVVRNLAETKKTAIQTDQTEINWKKIQQFRNAAKQIFPAAPRLAADHKI